MIVLSNLNGFFKSCSYLSKIKMVQSLHPTKNPLEYGHNTSIGKPNGELNFFFNFIVIIYL